MKKYIVFSVLIFLIAVGTLPVWSSGKVEKDPEQQDTVYFIQNQDGQHVQVLGGKSKRARNGLARAEQRATFMEAAPAREQKEDDDPDDDAGDDPVDRKKKK
jgi:hypothetical protein